MKKHIRLTLLLFCIWFIYSPVAGFSSSFRGDIDENGKVDVFDLLMLLTYIKDGNAPDKVKQHIANVDKSAGDMIDIFDLLAILRVMSGKAEPELIDWRVAIQIVEEKTSPEDTLIFQFETYEQRAKVPQLQVMLKREDVILELEEPVIRTLNIVTQDKTQIQVRLPWTFYHGDICFIEDTDTLLFQNIAPKRLDKQLAIMEADLRAGLQLQLADNMRPSLYYDLYRDTTITHYDSILNSFIQRTFPSVTAADSLRMAFEEFFGYFTNREGFKPGGNYTNTWEFDVFHKGVKFFPDSDSASLRVAMGSTLLPGDSTYFKSLSPECLSRFDEQERKEILKFCLIEIPVSFRWGIWKITSVDNLIAVLRSREFWQGRLDKERSRH